MSSPTSSPGKSVAVLGAGITGLSAAYRLARRGFRVRVFEAAERVGGSIRSEMTEGWLIEAGPNSLLASDPALGETIAELGLEEERVAANATAKNRYIVRGGRMVAAPISPPAFLRTPLFSGRAKIRLFGDLFCRRRNREADVSLESFIADHFGQELVDYGLNPFVGGVYAGDPKKLSAKYAFPQLWGIERRSGSIIRGQIAAAKARKASGKPKPSGGIISFRHGLEVLPRAFAERLPAGSIACQARVEHLAPGPQWTVTWRENSVRGTTHAETFDAVVAALPASALAELSMGENGQRPLASLAAIEHPPVASLFLGYRRDAIAHPLDGFGVLVPEIERRSVLGILFSSSLFPGRAPEGHAAVTVMVGGARQPDIARLSPDRLLAAVERDLRELLGVKGTPVFQRHAFWPRAIPQYNLGYGEHLEAIAATERNYPGLLIGGQARDGISVPACVAAGAKLAERLA